MKYKVSRRNLIIKTLCLITLICSVIILKQVGVLDTVINNAKTAESEQQEANEQIGAISLFTESGEEIIECESIVQGIKDNDLLDGEYTLRVVGVNGEVIDYEIELYNFYDDVTYSANQSLGSSTADQRMLVVKYHGNLTVEPNVTVTAAARKKGMYICVLGKLDNKGTITMTARGAISEGENVYLWEKANGIFDYIPATGASGGLGVSLSVGNKGDNGTNRVTGGGGSGGSWGTNPLRGGNGGRGTSYSGGSRRWWCISYVSSRSIYWRRWF